MKLAEVFSQLAYGELSQLFIGEANEDGELNEDQYPKLLASINLGLTTLYTRFNLKEGRISFPINPDGNVYKLGVSDLIKIERVCTDGGTDLALNNGNDPLSCYTPQMNILRVAPEIVSQSSSLPDKYRTNNLLVVYRAHHGRVVGKGGVIVPELIELDLPYSHMEALLYFVASRVHNPIGMVNEFNAGNNWAAKYEIECKKLESKGLEIDQDNQNERLYRNGWV